MKITHEDFVDANEVHHVQRRARRKLRARRPWRGKRVESRSLSRGEKLDRGKRPYPLIVPGRLLRISRALRRGVRAPLELDLAMLPAHPHNIPPARRILDQSTEALQQNRSASQLAS